MSRSVNDSRTNNLTPSPPAQLKVYPPNMLKLHTNYGITLNPKDQHLKDNFRFKTITSTFFHVIQNCGISEYILYPEISSPDSSLKKNYKQNPRWHFHGSFKITNIIDYISFYEYGFQKLAVLGSLEIHYDLNPTYPIKNKEIMKPICKHLKIPYVINPDNVKSMMSKNKDFYNRGLEYSQKIKNQFIEIDSEDDLLDQ